MAFTIVELLNGFGSQPSVSRFPSFPTKEAANTYIRETLQDKDCVAYDVVEIA